MGKPYKSEMAFLERTIDWAAHQDISDLQKVVSSTGGYPLIAVGSGGSLTAANLLVGLQRRWAKKLATVVTPLEIVSEPVDRSTAIWLLTAGGRNVDVLTAFRHLAEYEPKQLVAMCGRTQSPLGNLAKKYPYVDFLEFDLPSGKDGFLATNSLLAFSILLTRAYINEFDGGTSEKDFVNYLTKDFFSNPQLESWKDETKKLWTRKTIVVLHSTNTRVGAVDIESKFTEAALANLQISDYRNFAHGRHYWLAKRGNESAVLALITDNDRKMAERTLSLIPSKIPVAKLHFEGGSDSTSLQSLLAAMQITGWSASSQKVDPGRPVVPDFGHKLYHLSRSASTKKNKRERDEVAIERKTGLVSERLKSRGEWENWKKAFDEFNQTLITVDLSAVVLDYDGTLVDVRSRKKPPIPSITKELVRLVEDGVLIGIATGRGISARRDLQASIPERFWKSIVIGYYNGAEVGLLDDQSIPSSTTELCEELQPIAELLKQHAELTEVANITERKFQITLEPSRSIPDNLLWDMVHQILVIGSKAGFKTVRSSHSIDILAHVATKINVIDKIRDICGSTANILKIGDRGRWPGNDFALLQEPLALSVDEISVDPRTCWNLASRGQRGVAVTVEYLRSLKKIEGRRGVQFNI